MGRLAVFTAIYPGVERFLAAWHQSVERQTDGDFDLWISLDELSPTEVERAVGAPVTANWVSARHGDTPALVRQRGLEPILEQYTAVITVDSDDILLPNRVRSARAQLLVADLVGCALALVDEQGCDIGVTLGTPRDRDCSDVFPRHNIFGLSNSAYRTSLLARCLPIPAAVELVDWYLATAAWLLGARLAFDDIAGMQYRQHSANMVQIRSPFSAEQIVRDTVRVQQHFDVILRAQLVGAKAERLESIRQAAVDVSTFAACVVHNQSALERYVACLNALESPLRWWSSVADTRLRHMWTPGASRL